MQGSKGDTNIENRLLDTVGEGEVGWFHSNIYITICKIASGSLMYDAGNCICEGWSLFLKKSFNQSHSITFLPRSICALCKCNQSLLAGILKIHVQVDGPSPLSSTVWWEMREERDQPRSTPGKVTGYQLDLREGCIFLHGGGKCEPLLNARSLSRHLKVEIRMNDRERWP